MGTQRKAGPGEGASIPVFAPIRTNFFSVRNCNFFHLATKRQPVVREATQVFDTSAIPGFHTQAKTASSSSFRTCVPFLFAGKQQTGRPYQGYATKRESSKQNRHTCYSPANKNSSGFEFPQLHTFFLRDDATLFRSQ